MRLAAVSIGGLLAACGAGAGRDGRDAPVTIRTADDGWAGSLIRDPPLHPADVVLHDTQGDPYPLRQGGRDGVTALFFGFTHCADICPTTMADLAAARRALPPLLARRVSLVFVTVDPHLDRPRVLARWLGRFDPAIIGLRSPRAEVHRAEDSLYSMRSSVESSTRTHGRSGHPKSDDDGYQVAHSGLVYVFGPGGTSLLYTGEANSSQYADDFERLVGSS